MTTQWAYNLLSGNFGEAFIASTTVGCVNMVNCVSAYISGAITTIYPVIIAVAVLFGGYFVLKGLYHSRF